MAGSLLEHWGTSFCEFWLLLPTITFSLLSSLFFLYPTVFLPPSLPPSQVSFYLSSLLSFHSFYLWWTNICMLFILKLKASKKHRILFLEVILQNLFVLVCRKMASCPGFTIKHLFVFIDPILTHCFKTHFSFSSRSSFAPFF